MKRNDEIITPDGYSGIVLLCAGDWVTVILYLTHPHRTRVYKKSELADG